MVALVRHIKNLKLKKQLGQAKRQQKQHESQIQAQSQAQAQHQNQLQVQQFQQPQQAQQQVPSGLILNPCLQGGWQMPHPKMQQQQNQPNMMSMLSSFMGQSNSGFGEGLQQMMQQVQQQPSQKTNSRPQQQIASKLAPAQPVSTSSQPIPK